MKLHPAAMISVNILTRRASIHVDMDTQMILIENHWDEVSQIETELMSHMMVLGLDWHDAAAMSQLSSERKVFGPVNAQAAYASKDQGLITKAELFGLVSMMIRATESAARDNRDVHGGEVWKALGKHLYK